MSSKKYEGCTFSAGRYLLQPACPKPNSVGALLVFLHLLKRHANGFAKSLLGLVDPDPPPSNSTADFNNEGGAMPSSAGEKGRRPTPYPRLLPLRCALATAAAVAQSRLHQDSIPTACPPRSPQAVGRAVFWSLSSQTGFDQRVLRPATRICVPSQKRRNIWHMLNFPAFFGWGPPGDMP